MICENDNNWFSPENQKTERFVRWTAYVRDPNGSYQREARRIGSKTIRFVRKGSGELLHEVEVVA